MRDLFERHPKDYVIELINTFGINRVFQMLLSACSDDDLKRAIVENGLDPEALAQRRRASHDLPEG